MSMMPIFSSSRNLPRNQQGIGRLRGMLPFARPQVPDIDNLSKFVLDGMNKLVYEDDRQVVKLVVYKLLDCVGECEGRPVVIVSPFPCLNNKKDPGCPRGQPEMAKSMGTPGGRGKGLVAP
jgi:Endodeoxyribonuclease RusA